MNRETLFRFFRNETSREENFAVQDWAGSSDEPSSHWPPAPATSCRTAIAGPPDSTP